MPWSSLQDQGFLPIQRYSLSPLSILLGLEDKERIAIGVRQHQRVTTDVIVRITLQRMG